MGGESAPARDELDAFLAIRRHVKRLQGSTPLLLRTTDDGGVERLLICTVWVSQDLRTLHWKEQEGGQEKGEMPVSSIAGVEEEENTSNVEDDEDGHFALNLMLRGKKPTSVMTLICASPEDLESWREGLRFLVDSLPAKPSVSASSGVPSSAGKPVLRGGGGRKDAPAAASGVGGNEATSSDLQKKLRQQEELISRLKQENGLLQEIVKRKDSIIAELAADAQSRGTEPCSKTESTSRESDEHLRDRERVILQRKNRRLKRELQAKKQTVNELVKTLGRLNAQNGGESSAVEDIDEDKDSSDVVSQANADSRSQTPVARRSAADSQAAAALARQAAQEKAVQPTEPPRRQEGPAMGNDGDEDDESYAIEAFAQKLARLESALDGLNLFAPPARIREPPGPEAAAASTATTNTQSLSSPAASQSRATPAVETKAAAKQKASAKAVAKAAAAPSTVAAATTVPNARAAGAIKAARDLGIGVPSTGLGRGSIAALEAVQREMQVLDAKKKMVEQLARSLEPASDNEEEDDGFPLR